MIQINDWATIIFIVFVSVSGLFCIGVILSCITLAIRNPKTRPIFFGWLAFITSVFLVICAVVATVKYVNEKGCYSSLNINWSVPLPNEENKCQEEPQVIDWDSWNHIRHACPEGQVYSERAKCCGNTYWDDEVSFRCGK